MKRFTYTPEELEARRARLTREIEKKEMMSCHLRRIAISFFSISLDDKHVKRMTSMYICLHYSLHGYIFITLQVHFYTTVNNRSVKDTTNFNKRHSSLR